MIFNLQAYQRAKIFTLTSFKHINVETQIACSCYAVYFPSTYFSLHVFTKVQAKMFIMHFHFSKTTKNTQLHIT